MGKKHLIVLIGVIGVLLLSACSPPVEPLPEQAAEAPGSEEQPGQAPDGEIPFSDARPVLGTWTTWFDNNILIYIPAGEFQMGAQEFEDNPPRSVTLSDYWIYRYPVTNDMYRLCVATGACEEPATEPPYEDVFDIARKDYPVVGVSWEQAQTYCQWMGAELPTEAQWEKAARGTDGGTFPWGEDDPSCDLLNYQGCVGDTTPVLAYYPDGMSTYELLDTAGNTFEWTSDVYQEDYYKDAPPSNPPGPETGSYRSIRGSGFNSTADLLPLAHRAYLQPEKYREDLGFRCVVTEPTYFAPYCEQIAYIPGENKGPGQPPPGEPPQGPGDGTCRPEKPPHVTVTYWCANQGQNLGGATLHPDPGTEILTAGGLNVTCDLNNSPPFCTGPVLEGFDMYVCTFCEEQVPVVVQPSCDQFYTLDPVTGKCIFQGVSPIPATTCPFGWWLDLISGFCVPLVPPVDPGCPVGFAYNSAQQCCVATFIEPSGGWAGIPSAEYSGCPVGYVYDPITQVCKGSITLTGNFCTTQSDHVGSCKDTPPGGGCENPGQYGDQASCQAGGCKWERPPTGAGGAGFCTYP